MADRPPLGNTFGDSGDRERHEREQKRQALTEEQRQHVFRQEEENKKAYERKQQEVERRKHQDIEERKALIDREQPVKVYTPKGDITRKRTNQEIEQLATETVEADHKAELDAFKQELDGKVVLLINSYAAEKQRELREARESIERLSEQKRSDREATLIDRDSEKAREFRERVEARLRKSKKRDDRDKERDDYERE